jgi:tRNA C32,U32 (ribose-2'-O)-methylase TrmJ
MLTITIDEKTSYHVQNAAQAVQLAAFCGYMQALEDDDKIWNRYEAAIKALIAAVRNGELS